jgi:hypothetical protein
MDCAPHDLTPPPSPEHCIADLLRVTVLLIQEYNVGIGSQAQLRELEDLMLDTIVKLEGADSNAEVGKLCRMVRQFRRTNLHSRYRNDA